LYRRKTIKVLKVSILTGAEEVMLEVTLSAEPHFILRIGWWVVMTDWTDGIIACVQNLRPKLIFQNTGSILKIIIAHKFKFFERRLFKQHLCQRILKCYHTANL